MIRSGPTGQLVRILPTLQVHYRFHNEPPLNSTLNLLSTLRTFTPHLLKIQFNIIPSSTHGCRTWSTAFRISDQNFVSTFHFPLYRTHVGHLILLYLTILIVRTVHVTMMFV
jgi:hypothetical protein